MTTSGAMTSGRSRLLAFGRRHVSKLIHTVALVGVPAAVIFGTGGLHTIPFWLMAILWIPLIMLGLAPFGAFIFVLAPILWLIDKLFPNRGEDNIGRSVMTLWFVATLVAYVLRAELGDVGDIRLPTPWANLGALLVITAGVATTCLLLWLGGRLEIPSTRMAPPQRDWGAEEPAEEFWSDQYVVGWRAWRWEDGCLHGVVAQWRSHEYEATCRDCSSVPSWSHRCGVYAVRYPGAAYRFPNSTEVIGRVEMWGTVIEHEHGYRASHARITDLWVANKAMAETIRRRYRVAVHVGSPNDEKKETLWQR